MNIDSVSTSTSAPPAMSMAVQQLKVISEMQMEVMKMLAESQAQMSQIMQSQGIGQTIDISA